MGYHAPRTLDQALVLAAQGVPVVAGGTDVFAASGAGGAPGSLLDLTRVAGLRGIAQGPDGARIGATTTWADLARADLARADLPAAFDALQAAARCVGGIQIQNCGTLAGNLCNASPAADGMPPLLVLGAQVALASVGGVRVLPLEQFVLAPRHTALGRGEVMTAILIPPPPDGARGAFQKLGGRACLVISVVMVAAQVVATGGRIAGLRVAVGAASAVAHRVRGYEAAVTGRTPDDLRDPALADPALFAPLAPIGDVRGSAAYRWATIPDLCRRAGAVQQPAGGPDGRWWRDTDLAGGKGGR